MDFRELSDEEIKPHSAHPLPNMPRLALLPAAAAAAAPLVPGTTPAQVCLAFLRLCSPPPFNYDHAGSRSWSSGQFTCLHEKVSHLPCPEE